MNDQQERTPTSTSTKKKKLWAPDWLLFLKKFLRHGSTIASFVPSSVYLARAVVNGIDWSRASTIVELGAGTGPITKQILSQAPSTCRCLILERDPDFCQRLRNNFPEAEIIEADVMDLETILQERGIEKADHIVSGLPLPSFPKEARQKVLDMVLSYLSPEGTFRQLTHMPWVFRRMYRQFFQEVKFKLIVRNLPPAGFYVCRAMTGMQ